MEYRRLGRSGLQVSQIGLGTNQFGGVVDERQTAEIIHRALDLGINFIDTADVYTRTVSEQYIGKAIAGRRAEVVLATKTGSRLQPGANGAGLSRRRIIATLEDSLRRLGTDYVDVYYLHHPDPQTPIEESLRALDDLVTAGKIRYPAISNYKGWEIAEINTIGARRGYAPPVVCQSLYNVIERGIETDVLPAIEHFGMSLVPYSPLGSGFFTGKYRRGEEVRPGTRGFNNQTWQERRLNERHFAAADVIERFAEDRGRSVADLAIAWLLAKPVVCSVIAGVTKPEQVEANAATGDWKLSSDEVTMLDRQLAEAGAL